MRAALYARYSTDQQSEVSITDQLRDCARLAERHGFTVVAEHTDAAVSGGTAHRPGYQAMLEAARRGELDAIVAEDTSRLWRNLAEQAPRLAELADLGVAVVTHDLDTRNEAAGMLGAVLGASSEAYRREIGRRTRRGLEGRARANRSAGGRAYGYYSATESATGDRAVRPDHATVVREIFERFADGETMRAIAADLNARGVPSPAASWKRRARASDGKWRVSAIHSLLRNELYIGRLIWNRSRWVRSATDSRKRRRVENPRSEWIIHERPDLQIVDDEIWRRVQLRHGERAELFTDGPGGRTMYLLSGILRCAECGGAYVIAAHRPVRYGCATHRQAGAPVCGNRQLVRRDVAEERILGHVLRELLSPAAVAHAVATMRELAKAEDETPAPSAELERVDGEIAKLEGLRDAGTVSADTIAPALERLYRDRDRASRPPKTVTGLFGAEAAYRETVATLRETLASDDVTAVREALRELVGTIPLHPHESGVVAEISAEELLLVSGSSTGVVAGARCWIELS